MMGVLNVEMKLDLVLGVDSLCVTDQELLGQRVIPISKVRFDTFTMIAIQNGKTHTRKGINLVWKKV
jgi:hypothetical protein